jgi:4-hydroxy-4-methyl-2-oxoglutarate aldolase
MRRGIDGIVTGGNVRDSAWLSGSEFPVFAPAVSQAGAVKETPGSVNVPVVVGDVSVSPGDIVVGDADGVTVVPRQEAATILEATERKVEHEEDIRRRIDDGESLCEILGLEETLVDHDISIVDDPRESFDPGR